MRKIIAIDFDGCLCKNQWPAIGEPNTQAIEAAKRERAEGAALILWTCREGARLRDAVDFCRMYGLEFDAVNENLPEVSERFGGDCRKVSATEYWDDRAVKVSFSKPEDPAPQTTARKKKPAASFNWTWQKGKSRV